MAAEPPNPGPILRLRDVDFAYRRRQPVLRGVSLDADAGSVLGVIGPNGGGKTTLLRLLLGLIRPTRGTIALAGLAPRDAVTRGDLVGYLPQQATPPERFPLTVRQVVRSGLTGKAGLLRRPHPDDLTFADDLVDRLGLRPHADEPVGDLSGGLWQRTLIARALAPRPKILLLDEPTVGVDAAGQRAFIELLNVWRASLGLTIVLVSHDLRTVAAVADRIACLNTTLHYHDVPHRMPADLVFRLFACDLQAMGLHPHRHDPPTTPDPFASPATVESR